MSTRHITALRQEAAARRTNRHHDSSGGQQAVQSRRGSVQSTVSVAQRLFSETGLHVKDLVSALKAYRDGERDAIAQAALRRSVAAAGKASVGRGSAISSSGSDGVRVLEPEQRLKSGLVPGDTVDQQPGPKSNETPSSEGGSGSGSGTGKLSDVGAGVQGAVTDLGNSDTPPSIMDRIRRASRIQLRGGFRGRSASVRNVSTRKGLPGGSRAVSIDADASAGAGRLEEAGAILEGLRQVIENENERGKSNSDTGRVTVRSVPPLRQG